MKHFEENNNELKDICYEVETNISNTGSDSLKYTKMAVRYGYSYRKLAEILSDKSNGKLNFCLPEANEFLLWLGSAVLSGIAWDGIKTIAKNIYSANRKEINKSNDKETLLVFTDEEELYKFYTCIKAFQNGLSDISDSEYEYIEEEMMADFCAEMESEIVMREKRMITFEERKQIYKVAQLRIQLLVKR